MTGRLCALLVALAALVVLGTAAPAAAHDDLVRSHPADDAVLGHAVDTVRIAFEEPPSPDLVQVAVVGPDGSDRTVGTPTVTGSVVSVRVRPTEEPGRYEVGYRVVADDGHAETGTLRFTVTGDGGRGGSTSDAVGPARPQGTIAASGTSMAWVALSATMLGLAVIGPLSRRLSRPGPGRSR
jgi:methionine-rich copper-binding protein CopC